MLSSRPGRPLPCWGLPQARGSGKLWEGCGKGWEYLCVRSQVKWGPNAAEDLRPGKSRVLPFPVLKGGEQAGREQGSSSVPTSSPGRRRPSRRVSAGTWA